MIIYLVTVASYLTSKIHIPKWIRLHQDIHFYSKNISFLKKDNRQFISQIDATQQKPKSKVTAIDDDNNEGIRFI